MPSRAKAISSLVADAWGWPAAHPGTFFLLLLALTALGYWSGLLSPLDWWGSGEARR